MLMIATFEYIVGLGVEPDPFSFMIVQDGPNKSTLIVESKRSLKPSDFDPLRPYFPDGAELFVKNTIIGNGAEVLFTVRKEAVK